MHDDRLEPSTVPKLDDQEMETILAALAAGSARIERVELETRTVWIKRYGRHGPRFSQRFQWLASRLTGMAFLRPSPLLGPEEAVDREVRQIAAFSAAGFTTPEVLYRGPKAIVLSHLGLPVLRQMSELRDSDQAHDALLIRCAAELGRLHAAGLCHGRPHPRDFVLNEGRFGFLDFEEEPARSMPLEVAQARDVWLLFLQVASRCLLAETPARAYEAWRAAAPAEASVALGEIVGFLGYLLPTAHFLLRLRKGHDLVRFIAGTDYLKAATRSHP